MNEPSLREIAESSRLTPDEEKSEIEAIFRYKSARRRATWQTIGILVIVIFLSGFVRSAVSESAGNAVQFLGLIGTTIFAIIFWLPVRKLKP